MTMNTPPAVTPGPFAVVDKDGTALCHSPRQDRTVNSRVRREVKAAWMEALKSAGLCEGTDLFCTDGEWHSRGAGEDAREGLADFGHIIADANDGAFCGCNALPVEGKMNLENKDARQAYGYWTEEVRERYALAWRAVAMARMTKTKRSRAV